MEGELSRGQIGSGLQFRETGLMVVWGRACRQKRRRLPWHVSQALRGQGWRQKDKEPAPLRGRCSGMASRPSGCIFKLPPPALLNNQHLSELGRIPLKDGLKSIGKKMSCSQSTFSSVVNTLFGRENCY